MKKESLAQQNHEAWHKALIHGMSDDHKKAALDIINRSTYGKGKEVKNEKTISGNGE